jgi:hypothetical protein
MDRFEGEESSIQEKRYKEFLNIEFCPSKRYNIESLLTRQDGSEIIQIKTHQWYLTSNQSIVHIPSSKNPMVGEIPRKCIKKGCMQWLVEKPLQVE